jgi:N-acetylglutamate synthase-like GNAT family acetyltransferase
MTLDVVIGKASASDTPSILALLARRALPVDGLADHLDTAVVARAANRIVGSAALEVYPGGALLRSVAVDPAFRGSGLGRQLTEAAIALARTLGVSDLYLLTTTAEKFFPKFAFAPIARSEVPESVRQSVEFRSACPASAVVMRRRLT